MAFPDWPNVLYPPQLTPVSRHRLWDSNSHRSGSGEITPEEEQEPLLAGASRAFLCRTSAPARHP